MARSCEQALAAGVPSVAFTDHLDFTTWTDGDRISTENLDPHRYSRMHLLDVDGYLATIDECRQRYPDLRIFSGAEIGEAHMWAASAGAMVATAEFDRILGSLHAIPFEGRLTAADDLFRQLPADEVMRRYLGEIVQLIEGSDLFQVLAHLDFPRRMWPWTAGPYEEQPRHPCTSPRPPRSSTCSTPASTSTTWRTWPPGYWPACATTGSPPRPRTSTTATSPAS